jgi:hypothetical protein
MVEVVFMHQQSEKRLAQIARAYLKRKKVYRYRMKKIEDMTDDEVIQKCHWWYEEHGLAEEYRRFELEQLDRH